MVLVRTTNQLEAALTTPSGRRVTKDRLPSNLGIRVPLQLELDCLRFLHAYRANRIRNWAQMTVNSVADQ